MLEQPATEFRSALISTSEGVMPKPSDEQFGIHVGIRLQGECSDKQFFQSLSLTKSNKP
jgi:hypothetical protein